MINPEIFLVTIFIGFFAVMNPVGNMIYFQEIINNKDTPAKQQIALKGVVFAFLIVTLVTLFGNYFFRMLSLSIGAFRIAGGIYITLIGIQLMNGKQANSHKPFKSERSGRSENNLAFSPVASPLIAGPGTIMLAINFSSLHQGAVHTLVILVGLALNCLFCYYLFISSNKILEKVGRDVLDMISRIMGIIITVMGIQMLSSGFREIIKITEI